MRYDTEKFILGFVEFILLLIKMIQFVFLPDYLHITLGKQNILGILRLIE